MFRNAHRIYDDRPASEIAEMMVDVINRGEFKQNTVGRLARCIGADARRIFEIALRDARFHMEKPYCSGIDTIRVSLRGTNK